MYGFGIAESIKLIGIKTVHIIWYPVQAQAQAPTTTTFKAPFKTMASKNIVLTVNDWNVPDVKYMAPRINNVGGKSISVISNQTGRLLHLSCPMMMTWGIDQGMDDKGESSGKYKLAMNFPNENECTPNTDEFLNKMKAFQEQIIDDAVKNSEAWWGKKKSRELCEDAFFPFLKYRKNKDTGVLDTTRPPSMYAKVPFYDGKWGVEIYDAAGKIMFPCENEDMTPIDFIPKLSRVACGLKCTGIWIGGKGWGLTWNLFQCIVKPPAVMTVTGRCQIQLSEEDREALKSDAPPVAPTEVEEEVVAKPVRKVVAAVPPPPPVAAVPSPKPSTEVPDSDDEGEAPTPVVTPVVAEKVPVVEEAVIEEKVEVAVEEPVVEEKAAAPKKKIIKKAVPKL